MPLTLTLHSQPSVPLEAEALDPGRLAGLGQADIARLPVQHGNRAERLGDFFHAAGEASDGGLRLEGDLARVKLVGQGMAGGRIHIAGNVGMHLGAGMRGGEIVVEGDAGDWAGAEMQGGRIVVHGNAGHLLGAAYRGSRQGMQGGEIVVHGEAGAEVGNAMRRGLIAVGGNTGDFTGVNLLAGTIVVLGEMGWRAGAGMQRGTLVSMRPARILPTFYFDCVYRPAFLRLYLLRLRALGLPIADKHFDGPYRRWSGDMVESGRGEILLLDGGESAQVVSTQGRSDADAARMGVLPDRWFRSRGVSPFALRPEYPVAGLASHWIP
jgi:formylmethanofuran dehydrogenase subunit C